jgi:hypothetical protein
MPWTPSDDPVWLRDKVWTPEQNAFAEAYHKVVAEGGIAAGLVLIFVRHGLAACGGFLHDAKYNRQQLRQAAQDLKRVGGFEDLANLALVAADMKPKAPPHWRTRIDTRHRKRTNDLRKGQASSHRP